MKNKPVLREIKLSSCVSTHKQFFMQTYIEYFFVHTPTNKHFIIKKYCIIFCLFSHKQSFKAKTYFWFLFACQQTNESRVYLFAFYSLTNKHFIIKKILYRLVLVFLQTLFLYKNELSAFVCLPTNTLLKVLRIFSSHILFRL